ncbi:MAG: hypothetical protein IJU92_09880 [Spirochaetaceae bacterium]|nr:hypothetical protein [Spirochaetaceae bacterium]
MAIQPIDLQTLYTQMDKVGKNLASEQKAKEVTSVEQAERFNREMQIKETIVQESNEQNKIDVQKDGGRQQFQSNMKDTKKDQTEQQTKEQEYFRDPALGRTIDFSG